MQFGVRLSMLQRPFSSPEDRVVAFESSIKSGHLEAGCPQVWPIGSEAVHHFCRRFALAPAIVGGTYSPSQVGGFSGRLPACLLQSSAIGPSELPHFSGFVYPWCKRGSLHEFKLLLGYVGNKRTLCQRSPAEVLDHSFIYCKRLRSAPLKHTHKHTYTHTHTHTLFHARLRPCPGAVSASMAGSQGLEGCAHVVD